MTKINELKKIQSESRNELEIEVIEIILNQAGDDIDLKSWLENLLSHGCISGMVSELVHYNDTHAFYKEFLEEIHEVIQDDEEESGISIFSNTQDKNPLYNYLAWYGFERISQKLYSSLFESEDD